MEDKRLFQRVLFSHDAKLIIAEQQWSTQILDLSLHGFLCTEPSLFPADTGDHVQLELKLGDEHIIKMNAIIAHVDKHMLGMKCHHIDLDSIAELKRLMQLNIANEELLNRDITQLAR
ncbi:PilZ domain-containing protein [Psychrobium sp. 1_MG-2023]|uniref:PilZ domain-containing protein n=1 Tax=Psychrobium sp. 1_MG-2023 TaxID=3062624 RepID=UPI000C334293|nr:PilZ domain-containing protein [Psychrobium sp. 1_MG-2023]MDP2561811.1 PilZ domain-containing protein [Psychrobium sp. 1_MG-2023]PKF55816.1 PilZ domain-containing protein [Alteromonadales bacterium alter-6D02]